jgi:hypothetical protein
MAGFRLILPWESKRLWERELGGDEPFWGARIHPNSGRAKPLPAHVEFPERRSS